MNSFRIDLGFVDFIAEYKAALKKHPTFKNDLKKTLETLEGSPYSGDLIPRTRPDVFKIRIGVKGQFGKSGGYRLIYHVDVPRKVITPIALYFKGDIPNMPDHEVAARFDTLVQALGEAGALEPQNPTTRPN